ncbi:hypothetical protein GCM10009765_10720 [Fodinicola feengrottensis]|uniref:Uncharacterized protein n=1 Tax=Fodinicola feengrottensis TaxID=435914 RepID=A0ABN2G117_9ACTN
MNSSDTWTRTHERQDLLSELCSVAGRVGPDDLRATYGERIDAVFDDYDHFLGAAFRRWFTAFAAGLDTLLDEDAGDVAVAARGLASDLWRRNPGLWAIVDTYRESPAWRRQRQFLLATLGLDLDAVTEPAGGRREPAPTRSWLQRVG